MTGMTADLTLVVMGGLDAGVLQEIGPDTPVVVLTGPIESIRDLGGLIGEMVRVSAIPAPTGPDDGDGDLGNALHGAEVSLAQSSNSGASVTARTLNAPTKTATAPTPAPSPNTAHGANVTTGGRVA